MTTEDRCPKRMMFGPCGGVRQDGGCEVEGLACPFVELACPPLWLPPGHSARSVDLPPFLVDVSTAVDAIALRDSLKILHDAGAAGLIGEHLDEPVRRPPHEQAALVAEEGLSVVVTITARDRSADDQRREIELMAKAGVTAVHCVTGDHPAARFGPAATAEFVRDGTQLAAVARESGAKVSVGESPAAQPTTWRPHRVLGKQRAGADMAILNHAGSIDRLIAFVQRSRSIGVDLAFVAPVPVITDASSAQALAQFPGLVLPPGLTERVLAAADHRRAGIDAAAEIGRTLLDSGMFTGLNLSGSATRDGPVARAEIMAEVIDLVRSGGGRAADPDQWASTASQPKKV